MNLLPSPVQPTARRLTTPLLIRVGEDDRDAFEELYRKSSGQFYAFALSLLKNPDDTQDIVQENPFSKSEGRPTCTAPWANLWRGYSPSPAIYATADCANPLLCGRLQNEDSLQFSYVTDPTDRLVLESALRILGRKSGEIPPPPLCGG